MPQIEQLLQQFPESERQVRFSFDYRKDGYVARAMLNLPTGHLIARTVAPVADHSAAIDQVAASLAVEIERHHAWMRLEDHNDRGRNQQRDFAGAMPHLAALHDEQDQDGFTDVLRPLLRQLKEAPSEDEQSGLPAADVRSFEQVEQWLQDAWDHWNERPCDLPVELWLIQTGPVGKLPGLPP
jgi:ribosome-associated translation inhibitor RaiA